MNLVEKMAYTQARIRKIGKKKSVPEGIAADFYFLIVILSFTTFNFDMMLFIVKLKFIYRWMDDL